MSGNDHAKDEATHHAWEGQRDSPIGQPLFSDLWDRTKSIHPLVLGPEGLKRAKALDSRQCDLEPTSAFVQSFGRNVLLYVCPPC